MCEASVKILKDWVWSTSRVVNTWRFRETGEPRGHESFTSAPPTTHITCSLHPFHLAVPEPFTISLYDKSIIKYAKCSSKFVSCSSKEVYGNL